MRGTTTASPPTLPGDVQFQPFAIDTGAVNAPHQMWADALAATFFAMGDDGLARLTHYPNSKGVPVRREASVGVLVAEELLKFGGKVVTAWH